jgi:trehalose-6-phosphatase
VSNYPNLKKDYKEIQSMISGIDEDLMRAMFGDHSKVVVSTNGIEVEEYEHD